MRKVLAFVTAVFAISAVSQTNQQPLSQCDVMAYILLGNDGAQHLINTFQNTGIAFQLSEQFVIEVAQAGGLEDLVAALRKAAHKQGPSQFPCDQRLYQYLAEAARIYAQAQKVSADTGAHLDSPTSSTKKASQDIAAQHHETEQKLRTALALQSNNPLLYLALSSVPQCCWKERIELTRKAIELAPKLGIAYEQLASELTMQAYQESTGRDPDQKMLHSAVPEYEKAASLEPDNCWIRGNFATLLVLLKDYGRADKELDTATQQCPENTFLMYARANSLAGQGKSTEAISQLRSALKVQSCNFITSGYLASLLESKGDHQGAQQALNDYYSKCSAPKNDSQ
jgi:Tfp pilus assembly protein PilF